MYEAHKKHEIIVFDDLASYLDEKRTYSRKVDEAGEPTDEIENKNAFHHMDAERYIMSYIKRKGIKMQTSMIDWYNPRKEVETWEPARSEAEIERLLEQQGEINE